MFLRYCKKKKIGDFIFAVYIYLCISV